MRLLIDCDRSDRWAKQIGKAPRQRGSSYNCRNNKVRTDHFFGLYFNSKDCISFPEPLPGIISSNRISAPDSNIFDCAALAGFLLGCIKPRIYTARLTHVF